MSSRSLARRGRWQALHPSLILHIYHSAICNGRPDVPNIDTWVNGVEEARRRVLDYLGVHEVIEFFCTDEMTQRTFLLCVAEAWKAELQRRWLEHQQKLVNVA